MGRTRPGATPRKPTAVYAVREELFPQIFSEAARKKIARMCRVIAGPPLQADKDFLLAQVPEAEILITCWGVPVIDAEVVAAAKRLRFIAHGAGSVKYMVSNAMWERGIRISSAAEPLSLCVAEFCLGIMLTATKRSHWLAGRVRKTGWREPAMAFGRAFEIYGQNVGIIAASYAGRCLMKLLRPFGCRIFLYDPYCTAEEARAMRARKVDSLDELFSACRIVSLNAPITEETKGMIRGRHFAQLPEGALFINTARGVLINEEEMIEELRKERFVACLDVTDPVEPPAEDSELRRLPNVMLTPHLAGAIAENRIRLGDFVAREIAAYLQDRPLRGEITRSRLVRMA